MMTKREIDKIFAAQHKRILELETELTSCQDLGEVKDVLLAILSNLERAQIAAEKSEIILKELLNEIQEVEEKQTIENAANNTSLIIPAKDDVCPGKQKACKHWDTFKNVFKAMKNEPEAILAHSLSSIYTEACLGCMHEPLPVANGDGGYATEEAARKAMGVKE